MKNPDKESLAPLLKGLEYAIDEAVRFGFADKARNELEELINTLIHTCFNENEQLPLYLETYDALASKVFGLIDVAYICWSNEEPAIPLPGDASVFFVVRMRHNHKHCKRVLNRAQLHLKKHGKLLSADAWALKGG